MILAFDAKRLFNNFTGLGNYSRTFVKNMQISYPENEYHLFTPNIVDNVETTYFLDESRFTIHTPPKFALLWRTFSVSKQINALKPDIFHGLSHEIPFGINDDILTVVTFHDLIYEKFPNQFSWFDRSLYRIKYRSSAERSNHIIAISKSTKSDLMERYGINDQKISILYQSCHKIFQQQIPKTSANFDESHKYYLYVGSLIERKGFLQIVIAYSKLPKNCRRPFVVVGSGNRVYMKKINDLIGFYGLEKNFKFLNNIQNLDLIDIYDGSYALIYPSIYEGFGIPVIESLFRKKPVITSIFSSLPEAAGPGALYVDPYSPDEIQNAMLQLNEKQIYKQLQKEGYQYVCENFSDTMTVYKSIELYQILVKNHVK